jgi:hypothetical protein
MTEFEKDWDELILQTSKRFKVSADVEFLLFVVGLQELGQGFRPFSRAEKMDLMNMARCHLFCELGYLKKTGIDDQGWPVFETQKSMDGLLPSYQNQLIKKALIDYFRSHEII